MSGAVEGIEVRGNAGAFEVELAGRSLAPGLREITLRLRAAEPSIPPAGLQLWWSAPLVDIAARWSPSVAYNRGLIPDWTTLQNRSSATQGAPVLSHYSADGKNRMTFAASDAMNVVHLRAGVNEETASLHCSVMLFAEVGPPIQTYELTVRIDTRDVPFSESLNDVQAWWARQPGYKPSAVPDVARRPMYSTWYSFHQHLDVDRVVEQCRIAKELGCEAVIVDDGWQTLDGSRGYAFCGDWKPDRIPDMRGFVDAVHGTGLKFLLWYAVPLLGKNATVFARFKDQLLRFDPGQGHGVFDPRFPEVREYLIGLYERHMREWGLDGFKLDFVDCFGGDDAPAAAPGDGRDIASVPEAADRLLSDVMQRLRSINPEVMIEFRQSYVGPLMRKYGNIFRAGDCPNDSLANRMRTIDLRLLSGATAVHSDMLMWHSDEPVESAALQVIAGIFSVPQISVLLDRIPKDHLDMVRFWLGFWNANRDLLLDGQLEPFSPAAIYPLVRASRGRRQILAVYDNVVADVGETVPDELYLLNGTRRGRIVLEMNLQSTHSYRLTTFDATGKALVSTDVVLGTKVQSLDVPPGGMAKLQKNG